jgi:hypothetical protein
MQLSVDIDDLEKALGKPAHLWRQRVGFGSCSALVKPIGNNDDLFVARIIINGPIRQMQCGCARHMEWLFDDAAHTQTLSTAVHGRARAHNHFLVVSGHVVVDR